jgi:hypothetical protein
MARVFLCLVPLKILLPGWGSDRSWWRKQKWPSRRLGDRPNVRRIPGVKFCRSAKGTTSKPR